MAKILIVDDSDTSLAFMCTVLNNEGYEIIPFKDGNKALEYLKDPGNGLPNLIITDVIMPDIDGYTFHTTLQQDARTRDIPFIVMTAKGSLRESFEPSSNVVAFMEKPVNLTALAETVRKVVQNRR